MVKISVRKNVYLSLLHSADIYASTEAETEEEARRLVKVKLEKEEEKVRREYLENQKKCKHLRVVKISHLDGSTGIYCEDCGKKISVRGGLFSDDFLQKNVRLSGKRFRCKKCGFEFTWGDDDIDFCEHLKDKQPRQFEGLIEELNKD